MNKKQFGAIVLSGAMVMSLAACGGNKTPGDVEQIDPPVSSTVPGDEPVEPTPPVETPDVEETPGEVVDETVDTESGEVEVEILPVDYVNEMYNYTFTYPGEWADKVDITDNSTFVDFCVKGTTDYFMSLMATVDTIEDENYTLLDSRNGWNYYKVIAADEDLTNEDVREEWEALRTEAMALTENFKFNEEAFPEGDASGAPVELSGLAAVIHDNRNADDNQYMDIMSPENSDEFILEFLGLNTVTLDDWAVSMSMMNVKAYGIMVMKPAADDMEATMTALQTWVDNTKQSYEQYLADQYEIACQAVVKTVGDYAMVVMCEDAATVAANIETALGNMAQTDSVANMGL